MQLSASARQRLRIALARVRFPGRGRILTAGWKRYERSLADREGAEPALGPDGMAIPPPRLRTTVITNPSLEFFLESGKSDRDLIWSMLGDAGVDPRGLSEVLDFGCGCGRVARWWLGAGPSISGSDLNPDLAAWSAENLKPMSVTTNLLEPPLGFESASFDLIYGLSVLTHLSEPLQHAWMDELRRVLRADGLLWLSVMGAAHLPRFSASERRRWMRGELVERFEDASGSNACAIFHPPQYFHALAAKHGFEVLGVVGSTDPVELKNVSQDAYLLRPAAAAIDRI